MPGTRPRTFVYVDGFNLYYGAVKGTPYKWLDLWAAAQAALPRNDVRQVKYYTARVSPRENDPDAHLRQGAYLRALATLRPQVETYEGSFLVSRKWRPRADSPPANPTFVEVLNPEEKGSDVNLAAHLVYDGCQGLYEAAVLVTNDSDFGEAVRIVRHELRLTVGILHPRSPLSGRLKAHASFVRPLRSSVLQACQLPDPVVTPSGDRIAKPASW